MKPKFYLLHLHRGTILTQNGPYASEAERADEHERLRGNFVDHDHVIHDDEDTDTWIWLDIDANGNAVAEV